MRTALGTLGIASVRSLTLGVDSSPASFPVLHWNAQYYTFYYTEHYAKLFANDALAKAAE